MTNRNTPALVAAHSNRGHGLVPGEVVNGMYRVQRLLGRGGVGSVYLASDLGLHLPVALKLLTGDRALDPTSRARFDREARLMDSLRGLAVPRVLGTGFHHNQPYIAMTVAPGRPLSHLIARRDTELPRARAMRVFSRLIDLLANLAVRGVVHRDIKPDNVLVRIDGPDAETVTLVDFGLGLGSTLQRLGAVTQLGLASGTPHYLSPEQAGGRSLTPATDVYSLAVVCHEMLLGRPPFVGTDAQALIHQHVYMRPRSVLESGGDAPVWLDELLFRMMAKAPGERPTAAHVQAVLAAVADPRRTGPNPAIERVRAADSTHGIA